MEKYLEDGRMVEVISTVDIKGSSYNGYFVQDVYETDDTNSDYEYSTPYFIHKDKVFEQPPKQRYLSDISELKEERQKLQTELRNLRSSLTSINSEIRNASKIRTDLNKRIINFNNLVVAETLTIMQKGEWNPITVNQFKRNSWGKDFIQGLRITFTSTFHSDQIEPVISSCGLDWDGRSYSSDYINMDFGILINATDEEITAKALEVNSKREAFTGYYFDKCLDKYLSPQHLEAKRIKEEKSNLDAIENLEKDIIEKQQKLKSLKQSKQ